MLRFCELGRGRRPVTVIAGKVLITKAALKEMGACSRRTTTRRLDPSDPLSAPNIVPHIVAAAEEARDRPLPTPDPGCPLVISDHSYVTRVRGSAITRTYV